MWPIGPRPHRLRPGLRGELRVDAGLHVGQRQGRLAGVRAAGIDRGHRNVVETLRRAGADVENARAPRIVEKIQIDLDRILQKGGIFDHLHKGCLQSTGPIRRQTGGRKERQSHLERQLGKSKQGFGCWIANKLLSCRRIRQFWQACLKAKLTKRAQQFIIP